ncbi:hypothetical protein GCM10009661_39320 [Catellatospora chokoriensis]|uniref:Uncharacterized protein n=1 Tax=Catellatospora chokoriensis TaxID=310353 RepID=A0A8J3JX98_9ACTN|nr:hypothetical protein Cch02nite_35930 [Catellatospora chokoriensis]
MPASPTTGELPAAVVKVPSPRSSTVAFLVGCGDGSVEGDGDGSAGDGSAEGIGCGDAACWN